MKQILSIIIVVLSCILTKAAYPTWDGAFDGAAWPATGDSGRGLYQAYSSGGWNNELWHYNSQTATWTYIGAVDGTIYSLHLTGSSLYVGGSFTEAYPAAGGTVSADNIALVNTGTLSWSAKGNPGVVPLAILALSGSDIYVGSGNYTSTCLHYDANLLKRWNGSSWSTVGGGLQTQGNDAPQACTLAAC